MAGLNKKQVATPALQSVSDATETSLVGKIKMEKAVWRSSFFFSGIVRMIICSERRKNLKEVLMQKNRPFQV